MTTLRCPDCGTPHPDPPDPDALPFGTKVYVTCEWCENRYAAKVWKPDDPSDEIPPGMLAIAQLNGGGTATVAGSLRGNTTIASNAQAQAAARQHGAGAVQAELDRQQVQVELDRQQVAKVQQAKSRLERNRRGGI